MVQIQGIRIGLAVAAFTVALLTTNTLAGAAGMQISLSESGLPTNDDIQQTAGDFQNPEITGVGSQDPGFFGVAVGVTNTVQQLTTLVTGLSPLLQSYGVPSIIAINVQVMVDLVFGLGLLQLLIRFRF